MASTDTKTDAKAAPAIAGKLTFKLAMPTTFQGETYSEITYRRPKGRDMRKFLSIVGSGNKYTAMAVDLCELPEAFFDEMDGTDYMVLTDVFDGFFKRGPATSTM